MTAAERKRLVGILGRLGSEYDGERAAAGVLADRMLRSAGLTWEEIIPTAEGGLVDPPNPAMGWRSDLDLCRRHASFLRPWEQGFVASLITRLTVTPKQRTTLTEIAAGLRERGKS